IWIVPERRGIAPGYEQKVFPADEKRGRLRLVASHGGEDGSVTLHQEANLYVGLLGAGESASHALAPGRHAWVQVARGALKLNAQELRAGDGASVSDEASLALEGVKDAEVLVFDLN